MTDQLMCKVVKACVWNESAWSICDTILKSTRKKLNGKNLRLDVNDLQFYVTQSDNTDRDAYSDECYQQHAPSFEFRENPVFP